MGIDFCETTQAVKDACLKALKERLIDRAHIS